MRDSVYHGGYHLFISLNTGNDTICASGLQYFLHHQLTQQWGKGLIHSRVYVAQDYQDSNVHKVFGQRERTIQYSQQVCGKVCVRHACLLTRGDSFQRGTLNSGPQGNSQAFNLLYLQSSLICNHLYTGDNASEAYNHPCRVYYSIFSAKHTWGHPHHDCGGSNTRVYRGF